MKEEIILFEGFSGYGGASWALRLAKIPYTCIGYSEIDKHAINCYDTNFPGRKNYGNISEINTDNLPQFNLFTGGFPCQDVSLAGNRDLSKGRTNLYLEILRIAKSKKPKYMVIENVKGLLSMGKKGNNKINNLLIDKIVRDLKNVGYGVAWKVLNSKEHGIPQNRERVWFICKYGGWEFNEFSWPQKEKLRIFIKDILEPEVDKKYNLSDKQIRFITDALRLKNKYTQVSGKVPLCQTRRQYANWNGNYVQFDISGKGYKSQQDRAYSVEGVMGTIPSNRGDNKVNIFAMRQRDRQGKNEEKGQNIEFQEEPICNSLTSVQKDNIVAIYDDYNSNLRKDGCAGTLTENIGSKSKRTGQKLVTVQKDNLVMSVQRCGDKDKGDYSMSNIQHCLCSNPSSDSLPKVYVHNLQPRSPDRPSLKNGTSKGGSGHIYKEDGTTYCLDTNNSQANRLGISEDKPINCLTEAQGRQGSSKEFLRACASVSSNTGIYRRLTPKECFRLMGFLNDEINIDGIPESALYKLAGNGWDISVVSKIFKNLFKK